MWTADRNINMENTEDFKMASFFLHYNKYLPFGSQIKIFFYQVWWQLVYTNQKMLALNFMYVMYVQSTGVEKNRMP